MSKLKVVITDSDYPPATIEEEELQAVNAQVVRGQCKTPEEVLDLACDADAIIVEYAPISEEVIAGLERCRVISRYGIGVDNIAVEAAADASIVVTNVPDYCLDEVADHTMALLLALNRKIVQLANSTKQGKWDVWTEAAPVYGLRDSSLGLVGFGQTARGVAIRARSFGMQIVAYDPWVDEETFRVYNASSASLEELLSLSDFVSLHVPLTDETFRLIGERELKLMKPSANLVNTARGNVVDENALFRALGDEWIAGAAIDVLAEEPPSFDYELLSLDNIIVTPHAAFYSENSIQRLRRHATREVVRVLQGLEPTTPVDWRQSQ
jgi:D-3-phosphoglycerate dehydrogenase